MLLIELAKLVTRRGKQGEQRQRGGDGGDIAAIGRADTVCFRNSRGDSHLGIHRGDRAVGRSMLRSRELTAGMAGCFDLQKQ